MQRLEKSLEDRHYTLKPLEFDKIIDLIKGFVLYDPATKLVSDIIPYGDLDKLLEELNILKEAILFIEHYGDLPFGDLYDITEELEIVSVKGAVLDPSRLLKIKSFLRGAAYIKRQLVAAGFERLKRAVLDFSNLEELVAEIERVVDESANIRDDATVRLLEINGNIRGLRRRCHEFMSRIFVKYSGKRVLQDRNIHVRSDRFVFAVKSERRGEFPGIVIDVSSSGQTVYMEHKDMIRLNNELALLKKERDKEINRILKDITDKVHYHRKSLKKDLAIMAYIDFVFAKARFAKEFSASVPKISDARKLTIIEGRHPLLLKLKGKEEVVPLNISLNKSIRTVIITGPNTGGKTVALKTIGLLTLMALSAIPVTAHPDSEFFFFNKVLASIGDEQSIESSLSTFSSHITRIKNIVDLVDSKSLVLIDELGTGTDPEDGRALAVAIAEWLHETGSFNIITTHHGELKLLAYRTPGMENACVIFDIVTLRPTYKLVLGKAGESHAFAIARNIGLKNEIIERAELIKNKSENRAGDVIDLVEKIQREAEIKLKEAEKLKEDAADILNKARLEADGIINDAKAKMEEMLKEFEQALNRAKDGKRVGIRQLKDLKGRLKRKYIEKAQEKRISKGSRVIIKDMGIEGVVVDISGERVRVDTGRIVINTFSSSVEPVGDQETEKVDKNLKSCNFEVTLTRKRDTFFPEINLRGKRVDEALPELERFINDAVLFDVSSVRIIHGKGEGILKKAVWEYLKNHALVAELTLADEKEGGGGVTIVKLK